MSPTGSTGAAMRIPDLIKRKRDGNELSKEEIQFFVRSVCDSNNNSIQESQIGAMLMAIYFRGMNFEESFQLTKSMMNSGDRFDWSKYRGSVVDKHSTGGVGDKISLPLIGALAACGLKCPMISGRGLGFTGGTLDKLESIPNYKVIIPQQRIDEMMETIGCCIVGQSDKLNPADRTLYATRDITNTVDCVPLIAASIVSKKAIEDLDCLVLDVKVGRAAFMSNIKDAETLSNYMLQISKKLGFKAGVFLTRHDNPIGWAIGNQIEIEETIECLHGNMLEDMEELTCKYGGFLLMKTNRASSIEEGAKLILEKLKNKEALHIFQKMLVAQGVNEKLAHELCINKNYDGVFEKKAKYHSLIQAKTSGFIKSIDALVLGNTASKLGAGRAKSGDKISFEVGFKLVKRVGDRVTAGETWLEAFHNNADFDQHYANIISSTIEIQENVVNVEPLVIEILNSD